MSGLSWLDTTIVVLYLCCIFSIGLYAWWDNRRTSDSKAAISYFLAGRNVLWLSVAATLFSSNIGAEHFVGLAGTAASTGIAVGAFEWTAPFMLWMMAFFLCELYIKSGIVTTPEYLELRFNRKVRVYNALITLFIYVFVVISTTLYAGSVILETVMGWNLWTSSIILIVATGIYVTLGGLKAVVWTENIQTCILLIGGMIVMIFSMIEVGGISGLHQYYDEQNKNDMHLFRSYKDKDWPWPGITLGIFVNSYYYWNGQHLIVQRVLSAKSPLHAKMGAINTSILKILPVFIMVIPGMCAVKLYPEEFIDQTSQQFDRAYPLLVTRILPNGLQGIVIASMLSALMSSLAAVYNSASTIIVNDIYKLYYPNVSDTRSIKIGRIGACIFIVFSVLWLPNIEDGDSELFIYTQQVISYANPPLTCIYLFGHFWNRCNYFGAYCGLFIGFVLGITRFILSTILKNKYCQNIYCELNYLYFGLFLFIASSLSLIIGSLLTKPPDFDTNVDGLTYWTVRKRHKTQTGYIEDENEEEIEDDDDNDDDQHKGSVIKMSTITKSDDKAKSMSPIAPLMNLTNNKNVKKNKCRQYFWDFVHLEGDENDPKWNKIANGFALVSFLALMAMWIWFR